MEHILCCSVMMQYTIEFMSVAIFVQENSDNPGSSTQYVKKPLRIYIKDERIFY